MSSFRQLMMNSAKAPKLNAEIVGSPTISDDFIVSNFSSNNYLKTKEQFPVVNFGAEHIIEFNSKVYPTLISPYDDHNIMHSYPAGNLKFAVNRGKKFQIMQLGIGEIFTNSNTCSVNTWYWVKATFQYFADGSAKMSLCNSTDGTTWINLVEKTNNNPTAIIPNNIFRIGISEGDGEYFVGKIDMKETNVMIDNQYWWKGVI